MPHWSVRQTYPKLINCFFLMPHKFKHPQSYSWIKRKIHLPFCQITHFISRFKNQEKEAQGWSRPLQLPGEFAKTAPDMAGKPDAAATGAWWTFYFISYGGQCTGYRTGCFFNARWSAEDDNSEREQPTSFYSTAPSCSKWNFKSSTIDKEWRLWGLWDRVENVCKLFGAAQSKQWRPGKLHWGSSVYD